MELSRIRRHIYFFIFAVSATTAIYFLIIENSIVESISISTAYICILFFVAALSIGPIYLLLSRIHPVSIYLRRDLGIWSAVLAIIHTVAGLQVHLEGKMWLYFLYPPDKPHIIPVRYDPFGLTNHLGLVCTLIMISLLMLSNNRSLKKLGATRWKKWQRSSYFLAFAIPLHGIIYQVLEKRIGINTLILVALFILAAVIHITGIVQYRKINN